MSADLRTELNDCDNATGFVGDGATPAANVLTGQRYEGSASIDTQHSNADEQLHTTQLSGGGGTFSRDLSDSTCYLMVKDNLVDTLANGGVQFVIGDGTDLVGYDVGGNDAVGLPLSPFYNCYKLDVSERVTTPGAFNAYTGSEASLAQTTITQMGYGSLHLAKAQGNVANVFLDRMTHIANGSSALRINGGTSVTPETMLDVQGDDVTNGWGMVNQASTGLFGFFAPTVWGDPAATADSYFTAADEVWIWDGTDIGAGNFDFLLEGNATDTQSWVLARVAIVNLGARANLDLSDVDYDFVQMDGVTFGQLGAITMPTTDVDKFCNNSIFNNCAQVDPSTLDMDSCILNGSNNADGGLRWDEATGGPALQDNMRFNSDGTGNAIEVNPTGAGPFVYSVDGYTFDGYASQAGTDTDRVFFINPVTLSADITINLTNSQALNPIGGGTDFFSHRDVGSYTGTLIIQATVTLTVTVTNSAGNALEGISVRIENNPAETLITDGTTNSSGVFTDSFNFSSDTLVDVVVRKKGFKSQRITTTITSDGLDLPVVLVSDPSVNLP